MTEEAKKIGDFASKALTAAVASQGQSTRDSNGWTHNDRKRHFLEVFRRWEALFKRADRGDVQAEKWLIAEYFDSLGHLSPQGLEVLTKLLKAKCTFFPTIRECLDAMAADRYDWAHPFRAGGAPALYHDGVVRALSSPARALTHG